MKKYFHLDFYAKRGDNSAKGRFLKTKYHLNNILRCCSYRAVNTFSLGYKNQPADAI
jgi:hypothetical protein